MAASRLGARIARLRHEIERLSAKQAEKLGKQDSAVDDRTRELEMRRVTILERRKRQLEEMMDTLCREESKTD